MVIVERSVQVTIGCVKTCRYNLWRIEGVICALVRLFLGQSLHVVQKSLMVFIVVKVVHN